MEKDKADQDNYHFGYSQPYKKKKKMNKKNR